MELFDGHVSHGVVPPEEFAAEFPWYGCTMVVKSVAKTGVLPCVPVAEENA